jgi:hypothetical protein
MFQLYQAGGVEPLEATLIISFFIVLALFYSEKLFT